MKEPAVQTKTPEAVLQKASTTSSPVLSTRSAVHPILQLQRAIGNQGVQRFIQAKLTISQPDDPYEQEADRVAEQVMLMPDLSRAQSKRVSRHDKFPSLQRMSTEREDEVHRQPMEEEEELIQTKEVSGGAPEVTPSIESQINSVRGGGQSLPESIRAFFEPRFGRDFSQVLVHTDAGAARSAQAMKARAYTVGRNVVFGAGEFRPQSVEGKRLLAHEFAHVVQQSGQPTESVATQADTTGTVPPQMILRKPAAGIIVIQDPRQIEARQRALHSLRPPSLMDPFSILGPRLPSSLRRALKWIGDEGLPVRLTLASAEALGPGLSLWQRLRPWLAVAQRQASSFPARKNLWQEIRDGSARTEDVIVVAAARKLADYLPGLVGVRWTDLQQMIAVAAAIAEATAPRWRDGFASLAPNLAAMLDSLGPDVEWILEKYPDTPWIGEAVLTVLAYPGAADAPAVTHWINRLRSEQDREIRDLGSSTANVKNIQLMADILAAPAAQKPAVVALGKDLREIANVMDQPEGFILQRQKLVALLPRVRQQVDALAERVLTAGDGPGLALSSSCNDLQAWSRAEVLVYFPGEFDWITSVTAQIEPWAREQEPEVFSLAFNSLRGLETWSELVEETVAEEETLDEEVPTLPRGWWDIGAHLKWLFSRSKTKIIDWLLKKVPLLKELVEQAGALWKKAKDLFERFKARIFKEGKILAPLWEFFLGVLGLEVPEEFVTDVSQRGGSLLGKILRHPIRFLRNLALGIKGGLQGFRERIGEHLLKGLINWLLGEFEIQGPLTFSSVISGLMKKIGFNRKDVCDRIAVYLTKETGRKITGADVEERIDQVINIIQKAIKGGTTALRWLKMLWDGKFTEFWQEIKDHLAELWQWVVDKATEFVVEKVKEGLLTKLIKLLDPTGIMAVLTAIKTIYDAIKTVIDYAERMMAMIREVFRAVREMAEGQIEKAAGWVEGALAKGVAVAIAFLARFLRLDSVVEHLKKTLEKVRGVVHKALDALIEATGEAWKWLMKKVEEIKEWWKSRRQFRMEGETRDLYFYPLVEGKDAILYVSAPRGEGQAVALGTPLTLQAYLFEWRDKLKTDQQKGVHGEVTRVSDEIDEIKKKPSMSKKDGEAIYLLFNEIVLYLSELGKSSLPPETDVKWDTERIYGEEHGGSMVANPLSINPGGLVGSKPVASETKLWKGVKAHETPGGATYYIQGHLLNHHLHGAGVWKNMAPIARSTNTKMERDTEGGLKPDGPEGMVKKAVLGENKVVLYEVEMDYSGSHNRTPQTKEEAKLPRKIKMKAWVMEFRGDKWQKKGSPFVNRTFINEIR